MPGLTLQYEQMLSAPELSPCSLVAEARSQPRTGWLLTWGILRACCHIRLMLSCFTSALTQLERTILLSYGAFHTKPLTTLKKRQTNRFES